MPAPRIRGDYESLQRLASTFQAQSEKSRQTLQSLKKRMEKLQGGDWVGKGANKFYSEMNTSVLPAVQRLAAALERAAQVTGKMSQIIRQAEQDAAAVFRLDGGGHAAGDGHDHGAHGEHNKEGQGYGEGGFGVGAQLGATFGKAADLVLGLVGASGGEAAGVAIGKTIENLLDTDPRAQAVLPYMLQGDKQGAINEAIKQYGIDTSTIQKGPTYDAELPGDGKTFADGSVIIGDSAFNSPGWLASTIRHEALHAKQLKEGRWYTDKVGLQINEVEAYDDEIANAEKYGLSAAEVEAARARRAEALDSMPNWIKLKFIEEGWGNYTLPPAPATP